MKTQILSVTPQSLAYAKELIEAGEVVAFHTETVYGLGADARNDAAVQKIFALKGRPADNPLIAHVHAGFDITALVETPAYTVRLREKFLPGPLTMVYPSKGRVSRFVSSGLPTLSLRVPSSSVAQAFLRTVDIPITALVETPAYTVRLREKFLPGPLTMVYPSKGRVSRFVSSGLPTLSLRVPSSSVAQAFLRTVDIPIAAPSANRSKHVSPVTAQHVADDFDGDIPLILDGGPCTGGIESTVLDCTGDVPSILRAGLVTREMIAAEVGACEVYVPHEGEKPKSPGMAYKHYAPSCRTAFFTAREAEQAIRCYLTEQGRGGTPYFLCEHSFLTEHPEYRALDLGETPWEMAARLYAHLRTGERCATLLIGIEPKQDGGVMDGIKNRLLRAFGRSEIREKDV